MSDEDNSDPPRPRKKSLIALVPMHDSVPAKPSPGTSSGEQTERLSVGSGRVIADIDSDNQTSEEYRVLRPTKSGRKSKRTRRTHHSKGATTSLIGGPSSSTGISSQASGTGGGGYFGASHLSGAASMDAAADPRLQFSRGPVHPYWGPTPMVYPSGVGMTMPPMVPAAYFAPMTPQYPSAMMMGRPAYFMDGASQDRSPNAHEGGRHSPIAPEFSGYYGGHPNPYGHGGPYLMPQSAWLASQQQPPGSSSSSAATASATAAASGEDGSNPYDAHHPYYVGLQQQQQQYHHQFQQQQYQHPYSHPIHKHASKTRRMERNPFDSQFGWQRGGSEMSMSNEDSLSGLGYGRERRSSSDAAHFLLMDTSLCDMENFLEWIEIILLCEFLASVITFWITAAHFKSDSVLPWVFLVMIVLVGGVSLALRQIHASIRFKEISDTLLVDFRVILYIAALMIQVLCDLMIAAHGVAVALPFVHGIPWLIISVCFLTMDSAQYLSRFGRMAYPIVVLLCVICELFQSYKIKHSDNFVGHESDALTIFQRRRRRWTWDEEAGEWQCSMNDCWRYKKYTVYDLKIDGLIVMAGVCVSSIAILLSALITAHHIQSQSSSSSNAPKRAAVAAVAVAAAAAAQSGKDTGKETTDHASGDTNNVSIHRSGTAMDSTSGTSHQSSKQHNLVVPNGNNVSGTPVTGGATASRAPNPANQQGQPLLRYHNSLESRSGSKRKSGDVFKRSFGVTKKSRSILFKLFIIEKNIRSEDLQFESEVTGNGVMFLQFLLNFLLIVYVTFFFWNRHCVAKAVICALIACVMIGLFWINSSISVMKYVLFRTKSVSLLYLWITLLVFWIASMDRIIRIRLPSDKHYNGPASDKSNLDSVSSYIVDCVTFTMFVVLLALMDCQMFRSDSIFLRCSLPFLMVFILSYCVYFSMLYQRTDHKHRYIASSVALRQCFLNVWVFCLYSVFGWAVDPKHLQMLFDHDRKLNLGFAASHPLSSGLTGLL